jgi:hypothetical protein
MRYTTSIRNILLPIIALFLFSCATDLYQTISVGDSREKVIALLGKPGSIDKDLPPNRKELITSNLKKLDNHDSEYFSIWKLDENLVYVIGFNKKEKVAVKHRFYFTKGT